MERDIQIILKQFEDGKLDFVKATKQILLLFSVVGRSEQFYCASDKDNKYERCKEQCHLCKMDY